MYNKFYNYFHKILSFFDYYFNYGNFVKSLMSNIYNFLFINICPFGRMVFRFLGRVTLKLLNAFKISWKELLQSSHYKQRLTDHRCEQSSNESSRHE